MLRPFLIPFLIALASVGFAAEQSRVQYLMGTLCEIQARGETDDQVNVAITKAFVEISRLEEILSTYRSASEVSILNRWGSAGPRQYSPDLFSLTQQSISFSEKTEGAFDITLKNNGFRKVLLEEEERKLSFQSDEIQLDFGGIGKGYALDKAAEVLKKQGILWAELNFSGHILLFNQSPHPRPVALVDPSDPTKTILTLNLSNGSVSTSSQRERKNHIVDPRTGRPVDFQGSVTVVSPSATEADALSTALLVLGPKKGIRVLEKRFKDSAVLFLVPSKQGWIHAASSNFKNYQVRSN